MPNEEYEKLRKQYKELPVYDKINKEFEIESIEKPITLRKIKRKIGEKLEQILDVLERAINPDPNSFLDMYECRCFTDDEKKQVIDVFKHLMEKYRLLMETDLIGDDKIDADTIKQIFNLWTSEKQQIIVFMKKIRECWQEHVEPKEILEYLG